MTHKDIYTKFMIEYDKAGASTSYPSLTEYEVATILDKAYNALIAQKVTGNNVRRATFESDVKSIADLGPLTTSKWVGTAYELKIAPNVAFCETPENLLYFLEGSMKYAGPTTSFTTSGGYAPIDRYTERGMTTRLVNHQIAQGFFSTASNIPWIKLPVCFIEDNRIYIVYDPLNPPIIGEHTDSFRLTYIRKPNKFVKDLSQLGTNSYFDDLDQNLNEYKFECNDTVAEELISLAVAFALENVESQRLGSKLNMRGLEA